VAYGGCPEAECNFAYNLLLSITLMATGQTWQAEVIDPSQTVGAMLPPIKQMCG
jgi:hypothetical protein